MEEIWKDVKNYEGLYQVSNFGRVRSLYDTHRKLRKVPKILKQCLDSHGYPIVCLYNNGNKKRKRVHQLVWETFNGKVPEGYEINHIDENPQNGCLDNLNLLTHRANICWGTCPKRIGEANKRRSKTQRNDKKKSKPVIQKNLDGKVIAIWPSIKEIERQLGYSNGNICLCCNGKYTKAYGYIWEYYTEEKATA